MAIPNCTANTTVITNIGTTPDERGLSTDEFKAKFDETSGNIKADLNTNIIPAIEAQKMSVSGGTYTGTVAHGRNEVQQPKFKDYSEVVQTNSTATGSVTLNLANGNVHDITLTGNVTSLALSNPPTTGQAYSFTLVVRQGGTAYTIAWPSSVKWPSDVAPDISAINKTSIITFFTVNGGTRWYGLLAGNGLVT